MEKLYAWIDKYFTLTCSVCKEKVLDPDKKQGQIYLNGKCFACNKESKVEKKSKKERRAERKLQSFVCRAKY